MQSQTLSVKAQMCFREARGAFWTIKRVSDINQTSEADKSTSARQHLLQGRGRPLPAIFALKEIIPNITTKPAIRVQRSNIKLPGASGTADLKAAHKTQHQTRHQSSIAGYYQRTHGSIKIPWGRRSQQCELTTSNIQYKNSNSLNEIL